MQAETATWRRKVHAAAGSQHQAAMSLGHLLFLKKLRIICLASCRRLNGMKAMETPDSRSQILLVFQAAQSSPPRLWNSHNTARSTRPNHADILILPCRPSWVRSFALPHAHTQTFAHIRARHTIRTLCYCFRGFWRLHARPYSPGWLRLPLLLSRFFPAEPFAARRTECVRTVPCLAVWPSSVYGYLTVTVARVTVSHPLSSGRLFLSLSLSRLLFPPAVPVTSVPTRAQRGSPPTHTNNHTLCRPFLLFYYSLNLCMPSLVPPLVAGETGRSLLFTTLAASPLLIKMIRASHLLVKHIFSRTDVVGLDESLPAKPRFYFFPPRSYFG